MTTASIQVAIEAIQLEEGDPERQHWLEDRLYREFVETMVSDATLPTTLREKARLVHSTQAIQFPRWTA